jgi:hypothetical protein
MGHHSISVTVDIYDKWVPTANSTAVNKLLSIDTAIVHVAATAE